MVSVAQLGFGGSAGARGDWASDLGVDTLDVVGLINEQRRGGRRGVTGRLPPSEAS